MYPLVSVIIPFYNSIIFIKECLDSVVNQSYNNLEIILIDDGSTDGTYEYVFTNYSHQNNVKVLKHEDRKNKGVTETRRLGVKYAQGEFLAFLDSDDVFELNKIQCQVEIMLNNHDVVLTHSKIKFFSEISADNFFYDFSFGEADKKYDINLKEFINVNHICNSTVMVRKDFFVKVKFTSNHAFQYEDWIQWVLLSQFGKFYYLNKETCMYRYHLNSSTALLNKNGKTSIYANFEKNIILEKALRGKKNHLVVLESLQESVNDVYKKLFHEEFAPILIFNRLRYFKSTFKIYEIVQHFLNFFKR